MARPFLTAACLALPLLFHAQSVQQALHSVNAAFAGAVVIKLDKHDRLVMDFFDKGVRFRQDVATVAQLDPAQITYSAEEQAVVLNCRSGEERCITKEVFKLGLLRNSARSTLPCPADDPDGARTIVVLQDMIHSMQATATAVPAETRAAGSRTKDR
jgi:hypothetical protein